MHGELHKTYEATNTTTPEEADPFTERRYEQIFRHLPRSAVSVLDVGCNDGRGGAVLHQLNPALQVAGLDAVQVQLDALPECYGQRLYGLANQIPAEDRSFDVVVAGEFLEHLYPQDVDPTLCELQRVLKIGGRLLLTTPNPNYLKRKLERSSVYCSYHQTQHFPRVLKERLKMHGFSRVRTYGTGRVSSVVGTRVPLLALYGSYLMSADKH
jgi:SAM-dependent methyltransferase